MIKWAAVLLILTAVIVQTVYSKNLPSFMTACKRKDPNLNKCYLTFLKTLLKRSPDGIPELRIPPTEPFIMPQISIEQDASKTVNLRAALKNIAVHGISKARLTSARPMLTSEPRFEIEFSAPAIRIEADYIVDGWLLTAPIQGAGKCEMNLTEITGVLRLNTEVVERKRGKYLDLTSRSVEVNIGNGRFYFANLFNGNKQLGDTTNAIINQNWRELYGELRPVIQEAIAGVFGYIVKIVVDNYTYNEMFPEK